MLAPKATLAAALLFGIGFDSVVVCTGAGLRRVTLSPSGEILAPRDAADALVPDAATEHCAPAAARPSRDLHAWSAVRYAALVPAPIVAPPTRVDAIEHVPRLRPVRAPPRP